MVQRIAAGRLRSHAIAVLTDEGLTGWGSVFTSEDLTRSSLAVLEPLYSGENALEPERVSEKLHQNTFWLGRGGAITHTISGIDIALVGSAGQGDGATRGAAAGRTVSERVRPYASLLMREPERMADELLPVRRRDFAPSRSAGGRLADAMPRRTRPSSARRGRRSGRSLLMVDAGASDAFGRRDYKWAVRTAEMLADYDVYWFEEPLHPDALQITLRCAGGPLSDRGRRSADAAAVVRSVAGSAARSTSCSRT